NELLAFSGFNAQRLGILEVAASVPDFDAAEFGQLRHASGKFGQDGILPRPELHDIDVGSAEGDSAMFRLLDGGERVRGMEQGFGRDATAGQANAAELFVLLDEDNFLAEVSGIKGGGVSTGSRSHDCD